MASRALVLDANILIRAVLGNRVRRILEKYADSVSFFVPESAYSEAEGHLAALVTKRGGDPATALGLLRARVGLADLVSPDSTVTTKRRRGRDSVLEIPTTGRFSHQPLRLVARSGPKTPTSSDVALQPGRLIAWISS